MNWRCKEVCITGEILGQYLHKSSREVVDVCGEVTPLGDASVDGVVVLVVLGEEASVVEDVHL